MPGFAKRTATYKVADGHAIKADVYTPSGGRSRPVVIWIHGGALMMGWRGDIGDDVGLYLDAGYAVVAIDYRLAPEAKLPSIVEDLRDAARWIADEGPEFGCDPMRLAVVGHSAGGYLTLMSGICISPRPAALVSFYGYGDIVGPWYSQPDPFYCTQPAVSREDAYSRVGSDVISEDRGDDRGRFYLYCRQQGLWPNEVGGSDPNAEPEFFAPFCPVRNVARDYPPTLLLHGDADTDVPYEQSVMMAHALERAGVEHKLVTFSGAGHGFGGDEAERARAEVASFLRAHLG